MKENGIANPAGQSRFAKKRRGEYQPQRLPQRPSWFVRYGWAQAADVAPHKQVAHDSGSPSSTSRRAA